VVLLILIVPAVVFAETSHRPARDEGVSLLLAVCSRSITFDQDEKGLLLVCDACPQFTPGGRERFAPLVAALGSFRFESIIYGSFTAPGAGEAVLSYYGCASHIYHHGGSVLLRRASGEWSLVDHEIGVITDHCQTYRLKSGRDILLCQSEDGGQGQLTSWVFTYDFNDSKAGEQVLLHVSDTSGMCWDREVVGGIDKIVVGDLKGDRMPDLSIFAHSRVVHVPREARDRFGCHEHFKPSPAPYHRVDFLFNGTTFTVAPWSAGTREQLEAIGDAEIGVRLFREPHTPGDGLPVLIEH
jgi:hypothetical protein